MAAFGMHPWMQTSAISVLWYIWHLVIFLQGNDCAMCYEEFWEAKCSFLIVLGFLPEHNHKKTVQYITLYHLFFLSFFPAIKKCVVLYFWAWAITPCLIFKWKLGLLRLAWSVKPGGDSLTFKHPDIFHLRGQAFLLVAFCAKICFWISFRGNLSRWTLHLTILGLGWSWHLYSC